MSPNQPNSKSNKKHEPTFTDEEICKKAYEIWLLHREKHPGNSDADWTAAIEALKFEHSLPGRIKTITWITLTTPYRITINLLSPFKRPDDRTFALDVVKTYISSFSLLATILAGISLYTTYQNNNERLITDRFSKSVEQLGSANQEIRLGGIYALERISKDSHKDYLTIMEILTTFVREHTKNPCLVNDKSKISLSSKTKTKVKSTVSVKSPTSNENNTCPITPDVQAVMTVLGRHVQDDDLQGISLDLHNANLPEASLNKANLSKANLNKTNLSEVNLRDANLRVADLGEASLNDADLGGANLSDADLGGANLSDANLSGANLSGANLYKANLREANLDGANLRGAILSRAVLNEANLDKANLDGANLREAILSGAVLNEANLREANLDKANLDGANLREAILSGAVLNEANLIHVKNLTLEQVKTAIQWNKAKYSLEFRNQLGLPPEKAPVRNSK